jgi:hypothetical protein
MIDHSIELYLVCSILFVILDIHGVLIQVVESFLRMINQIELLFNGEQYGVLHDIHLILSVPHACQQLLAVQKTPTLPLALLVYEKLVTIWTKLMRDISELLHYISLGVTKIQEYVLKGCQSCIYALAMGKWC